ncbi:hypothetical protein PN498_17725 [Oscillatoria sp. CS-180]|uniref:hypothetical protein n=1 Tax=Oscillatoria sp. CS-180 TaxID=3021720 RepID=UPI00232CD9A3|nr:hypothetical protein [Oscillatoria sp. CS-180]MDB9527839.1 hypothetical protein [Oscillatoria sp. CS-180]
MAQLQRKSKKPKTNRRAEAGRAGAEGNFPVVPLLIGVTGVSVGAICTVHYRSPEQVTLRQLTAQAKQAEKQAQVNQLERELEKEERLAEAEKAHDRYEGLCTMLTQASLMGEGYDEEDTLQVVALTANTVYRDISNGQILPPNQIVCDDRGVTGVIMADDPDTPDINELGMITDIAKATEADLVNQRYADQIGWKSGAKRSFVGELSLTDSPEATPAILNSPQLLNPE